MNASPLTAPDHSSASASRPMTERSAPEESVECFGEGDRLLGLVTPGAGAASPVACLLVNAGVIHRVGPHRLNVKLARSLATKGVTSIRFDLSGLGDSLPSTSGRDFRQQAVADLQAAMDHMERTRGLRRFALVGVCSGAMNGYYLALADPRLVGLGMFDGYAYPTWKTPWARSWVRWKKLPASERMRGMLSAISRLVPSRHADNVTIAKFDTAEGPSRLEFAQAMNALTQRGVSLLFMMSGGLPWQYSYAGQLRDGFAGSRFVQQSRYEFMPDVDHTVTSLASQRRVIGLIERWMGDVNERAAHIAAPRPSER